MSMNENKHPAYGDEDCPNIPHPNTHPHESFQPHEQRQESQPQPEPVEASAGHHVKRLYRQPVLPSGGRRF